MKGVVAAPELESVEVGRQILLKDGNAIDAAVAVAFAQGVAAPTMSSIGGWGILQVYCGRTGEHLCIDFHGRAPLKATVDMFTAKVKRRLRGDLWEVEDHVNAKGYLSVACPGNLAGYWEVHRRFGRLPWREVVQPAIELAEKGFVMSAELAESWSAHTPSFQPGVDSMWEYFQTTPDGWRIFANNGKGYKAGDRFANRDYASTLSEVADRGPEVFYKGWMAQRIAEEFARHGGLLTEEDFRQYKVSVTAPLCGAFRGNEVRGNQPPSSGVQVLETLNILEGFDLAGMGFGTADYFHVMALAQKAGYVDRGLYLGDPAFQEVPVEMILSEEQADTWRRRIRNNEPIQVPGVDVKESVHTTTVSAMDEEGNAIGMTHTLATPASGVVVKDLGFMFNNAMHMFYPFSGHPNSIAPGKARLASMCPMVVLKDGKPWVVVGSPGGSKIPTANLQGIVHMVEFGMTALEAVYAPRVHNEGGQVDLEARAFYAVKDELERRGHKLVKSSRSLDPSFALLQIATRDPKTGRFDGASDPRARGTAAVVN